MNRRGFLGIFAGAAATAVLDPERLLWVPGEKKIFIPPVPKKMYEAWVLVHGPHPRDVGATWDPKWNTQIYRRVKSYEELHDGDFVFYTINGMVERGPLRIPRKGFAGIVVGKSSSDKYSGVWQYSVSLAT